MDGRVYPIEESFNDENAVRISDDIEKPKLPKNGKGYKTSLDGKPRGSSKDRYREHR